jgi:hypothetical protein
MELYELPLLFTVASLPGGAPLASVLGPNNSSAPLHQRSHSSAFFLRAASAWRFSMLSFAAAFCDSSSRYNTLHYKVTSYVEKRLCAYMLLLTTADVMSSA